MATRTKRRKGQPRKPPPRTGFFHRQRRRCRRRTHEPICDQALVLLIARVLWGYFRCNSCANLDPPPSFHTTGGPIRAAVRSAGGGPSRNEVSLHRARGWWTLVRRTRSWTQLEDQLGRAKPEPWAVVRREKGTTPPGRAGLGRRGGQEAQFSGLSSATVVPNAFHCRRTKGIELRLYRRRHQPAHRFKRLPFRNEIGAPLRPSWERDFGGAVRKHRAQAAEERERSGWRSRRADWRRHG